MNIKLLAASALLVQSGALLVSDNYKLAYGLQTVSNLVFNLFEQFLTDWIKFCRKVAEVTGQVKYTVQ
jgi:hypothetical protein